MASIVSGRNSVEQDDELIRRYRQTPKAPIKMPEVGKYSGFSAQSRRGLFQPPSPASSESSGDLGHMSPLSSSLESIASPAFSPNGTCYYDTPVKTPSTPTRAITVRSALFPALQKHSPKLRRSPRSSQTVRASPSLRESMAVLLDIVGDTESNSSCQTTPRSSRRKRCIVAETVTSPSSVGTPPSQRKPNKDGKKIVPASPIVTTQTLEQLVKGNCAPPAPKPVSPDLFYAPTKPIRPGNFFTPAVSRPTLVIDTLGDRSRKIRRDSDVSKRSFVSGAAKRQRSTSDSTSRSGKRHKGLIPGVWHGIKKPKKMNKNAPKPKPVVSPNARVETLKGQTQKRVNRGKRLFEEKPRRRRAGGKKNYNDDDAIIDTFPSPLIKRKKLPSSPVKEPEPDQSKKFLKLGAYRKATFKLNNMQLEFKNGKGRVKTPEKPRMIRAKKLFKAPTLESTDFSVQDPETNEIQKDIDNILQQLSDGDQYPKTPERAQIQVKKISDAQLMSILDSPSTMVKFVSASPSKMVAEVHSSPQRALLADMSSLALNEIHSRDFGRLPLDATGGILSAASHVLNAEGDGFEPVSNDRENQGENGTKIYPVFDSKTWKNNAVLTDLSNVPKQARRKMQLVPDDQYLLDAGQNSIGVVCCKECGVMYQAGDYLDEVAHKNVHNHLTELTFQGWKEERVVSKFKDGRVVMVTATDPKPWQEKAKKVVGVVDLELGFAENTLSWTPDKKVFLFICEKLKQVVGCLVSEACTAGYRMYPSIEGVEVDTCARDPAPCKVGISRIWTAVHRRRRGVATKLFQTILRISGDVIPDDVAFSIPSPDGKLLARSLMAREDFKVYGFLTT